MWYPQWDPRTEKGNQDTVKKKKKGKEQTGRKYLQNSSLINDLHLNTQVTIKTQQQQTSN